MSFYKQTMFWSIALLAFVLVLYLLRPILLPFIAGMALAYALDPLADRLQRLGLNRLFSTLIVLGIVVLTLLLAVIALVPVLTQQIVQFAENIPQYSERLGDLARQAGEGLTRLPWISDLLGMGADSSSAESPLSGIGGQLASWLGQFLQSLLSGGMAFVNLIALLVVTPVVAFYMLLDWDRLVSHVDGLVPREHVETVRDLARQIDRALAGFVRGQGLVCIVLGVFYAGALSLVGLNFGLLIGFGAGLISFVPYVGSLLGFVVSVSVALVQFWPDWPWVVAVAGIFMAGQFIEGNFLQPNLVGSHVGLHPVWLIFALFAFGYLFGFVGMLLAVPLAAAAGVLARFAVHQYRASAMYRGGPPGGSGTSLP